MNKNSNKWFGLFRLNLIPYSYEKIIKRPDREIKILVNPIVTMIRRKSGQPMVAVILRLLPAIGGKTSQAIVRDIKYILRRLSDIANSQGIIGLVKHLKSVSVLTQQAICGYKINTISPRVSRTNSGIPRLFPVSVRNGIRRTNFFYVRFALTVGSLYRDLTYKAPPKLATITDPFSGDLRTVKELKSFIPTFVKLFVGGDPEGRRLSLRGKFLWFPILKSGPQTFGPLSNTNPIVLVRSAIALTAVQIQEILLLAKLSLATRGTTFIVFQGALGIARQLGHLLYPLYALSADKVTGKLGFKQEAAGKVRVFAMVDPWTQLIMLPFHRCLFKYLSKHSRIDGTFNQLSPIKRIQWGKPLYSMDLSSATDRLPIMIQTPLIKEIFNLSDSEAEAWAGLLVTRPYSVEHKDLPGVNSVRYSVGQPMGALSSWAMLAFTHHLIVQFAARHLTNSQSLYKDYAVLGDDIVIFNHSVAKRYHSIITSLGVECNLAKSIMSPKGVGLEFAKRTFLQGTNVSPAPLKELASALVSIPGMVEYCNKYSLTLPGLLKASGFGYRVIGGCNRPLHKLSTKVRYLVMGVMMSTHSLDWLNSFQHLRRYFDSEKFILTMKAFMLTYIEGLCHKVGFQLGEAKAMRPDTIPSDIHPHGYGAVALPPKARPQLRQLAHYFAIKQKMVYHKTMLHAFLELWELHRDIYKGFVITINDLHLLITKVMKIEQDASKVSLQSIFERSDDANFNRRPGFSKLFRVHQSYCSLMSSLKNNVDLKRSMVTSPDADSPSFLDSMRESGFIPIRLLVRSSLILSRILGETTQKVVFRVILNRLKWLGGYTAIFSLFSFWFGIAPVVTFFVSVWSAFELLVNVAANSLPMEGSSTVSWISQTVGFIILHVVELWIVTAVFVCGYHWSTFCGYWSMMNQAYQLGDFSFWFCLTDLYFFVNRLIIDTAMEVTPVLQEFGSVIMHSNSLIQIGFGALMAYIGMCVLRWFLGF